MKRASSILNRLLHPPLWALIGVPAASCVALAAVFVCHYEGHALAYLIYSMSAYSLIIWAAAVPKLEKQVKSAAANSRLMQKVTTSEPAMRYLNDPAFRGSVSLHQGMAVNFLYAVFRVVVGMCGLSQWRLIIWPWAFCAPIWSSVTDAEPRHGNAAATAGRHGFCFC